MTTELNPIAAKPYSWKGHFAWLGCFLAVTVYLQFLAGAYHGEFGSEPDEAAHYVTGLFIHDYVKAGFPKHARQFADDYYNHYPKVAIGHWGPTFYLMQTAWAL